MTARKVISIQVVYFSKHTERSRVGIPPGLTPLVTGIKDSGEFSVILLATVASSSMTFYGNAQRRKAVIWGHLFLHLFHQAKILPRRSSNSRSLELNYNMSVSGLQAKPEQ